MNKTLQRQRKLFEAATPGRWRAAQDLPYGPSHIFGAGESGYIATTSGNCRNNAKAIVAAMNQREVMFDLVESVGGVLDLLKEAEFGDIIMEYTAVIEEMEKCSPRTWG